ncbi:MAG: protein kinase [Acidobacteriota bacterium]
MALASGTSFGHYTISALLGAGGMGEVYRARDSKLERDVAVKVLPKELSDDPDRLTRFELEAKALGALNHPNIATVHGFESEGDVHFLVMELVEGEDLATRLKSGPLPIEEALSLFVQIAEGLEAAHDRGIVHRDLKPANVMMTTDGRAKVLDFGLARSTAAQPADLGLSHAPTRTEVATTAGRILGTSAYMSPEQARGGKVGAQTDLWAFGACLYEALSGQPAFDGDGITEVLAAVLKEEPAWNALPREVGAPLRRLLSRCLAKNARERQRSAGDLALELRELASLPDHSGFEERANTVQRARRSGLPRPHLGIWIATALVAAVGAAFLAGRMTSSLEPADEGTVRFSIETRGASEGAGLAFSPNGRTLLYRSRADGTDRLYRHSLDSAEPELLLQEDIYPTQPFFSPDGESVGFFSNRGLRRISMDGGASSAIVEIEGWPGGATWLPDGRIVYATTASPMLRIVDGQGGEPSILPGQEDGRFYRWPRVVAGGRALVAAAMLPDGSESAVTLISLEGAASKELLLGDSPRVLSTEGEASYLVYWREGTLWGVRFDQAQLVTRGEAVPLVDEVFRWAGAVEFDVSSAGDLAVVQPAREHLVRLSPGEAVKRLLPEPDLYGQARVSPDGQRLLYARFLPQGDEDVFVLDLGGRGLPERLTHRPGPDGAARWGPEPGVFTYVENRPDGFRFVHRPADLGAAQELEVLFRESLDAYPTSWSKDGELLPYIRSEGGGRGWVLWLHQPGEPNRQLQASSAFEAGAEISPDGSWIAYESNRSSSGVRVYVAPFPEMTPAKAVSGDGGRFPLWEASGKTLYFRTSTHVMQVQRAEGATEWQRPEPVLELSKPLAGLSRDYDMDGEGRVITTLPSEERPRIEVTLNLARELAERLGD